MSTEPSHSREYFDMYGLDLDLGDWSYVVDDTCVRYVNDWYPYDQPVRLAPDLASYSWRNEYVAIRPTAEPRSAKAVLRLAIRRQGSGVMAVDCEAALDLQAHTFSIRPDDLTGGVLHQAQVKARRVLDLLAAERLRQRTHPYPPAPVTAAELEDRRQQAREEPQ